MHARRVSAHLSNGLHANLSRVASRALNTCTTDVEKFPPYAPVRCLFNSFNDIASRGFHNYDKLPMTYEFLALTLHRTGALRR